MISFNLCDFTLYLMKLILFFLTLALPIFYWYVSNQILHAILFWISILNFMQKGCSNFHITSFTAISSQITFVLVTLWKQKDVLRWQQRRFQNPSKRLTWSILQKLKAVNYFRKTLRLRCLTGFWVRLWTVDVTFLRDLQFISNYLSIVLVLSSTQWVSGKDSYSKLFYYTTILCMTSVPLFWN